MEPKTLDIIAKKRGIQTRIKPAIHKKPEAVYLLLQKPFLKT
jgi:hypothetical protein